MEPMADTADSEEKESPAGMTRWRKFWIGTTVAIAGGPLLALSLLIPLPITRSQADRAYRRLLVRCAGEDARVCVLGALPELSMMRPPSARVVFVYVSDNLDTARKWFADMPRVIVLPRGVPRPDTPGSAVMFCSPGVWIRGDRTFTTTFSYGGGSLSMHGMVAIVQRSWLGTWIIACMTFIS